MKRIIIGILILFLSISVNAQLKQSDIYQSKYERYARMKKDGIILNIIGGIATGAGFILLSQAEWETTNTAGVNYNTNDMEGSLGILATGVGVPMLITGVILGAIGNKKEKEYKYKLLHNTSLNIKSTPQMIGLSLTYKF